MIKNIFFDLGGVVITHPKHINEKFLRQQFSLSFPQARKVWLENRRPLLVGKETDREFLAKVSKKLHRDDSSESLWHQWWDFYQEVSKDINWPLLELVKRLKRSYKIYLLTDTIALHDRYHQQKGLYDYFERVFKSFQEGFMKPSKEAYLNPLRQTQSKPDESVFVDDLEENVKGAEAVGMQGVVYQNFRQLKSQLRDLEVKF
ncbi:hypothetical protein A3A66_04520 [Microgenomates group bacterium RIFCSPLOWO2_01_FULL_46_13]|nr:MAG: hypothetical protein A3A66_04520 [Microgenomates group bacterium RIFCSPLOWO2_01_FULL_46_13]